MNETANRKEFRVQPGPKGLSCTPYSNLGVALVFRFVGPSTLRTIIAILALTAVLAPALAGAAETAAALEALFAAPDPAADRGLMQAVLKSVDGDAAKLKAAFLADAAYPKFQPGWQSLHVKASDGKKSADVEFLVRVPGEYSPEKSWPLVLAAHGQKGKAQDMKGDMERLLGKDVDKYVIVAAQMPPAMEYAGQPLQEQVDLAPLAWARRNLNIDPDRVVMTGYSMGGIRTWHLAVMYPHLFAAAVPVAGKPWFEGGLLVNNLYLENLSNLPVWAAWGEKDGNPAESLSNVGMIRGAARRLTELGNKLFKGTEYPGRNHHNCWPAPAEFQEYLAAAKRNPVPASITRCFHLSHHGRAYYVEAVAPAAPPVDFGKEMKVPIPAGSSPEAALAAAKDSLAKSMCRLNASLDAGNVVTITGKGVRSARLYVTEGMFDLSKPVTVKFWSGTWTGKIPLSAECMLKHYAATRDRTALVYNELELDISGKARLKYP